MTHNTDVRVQHQNALRLQNILKYRGRSCMTHNTDVRVQHPEEGGLDQ